MFELVTSLESIIELVALMAATGLLAGILSGLFGVGGGIILVPVLDYALGFTTLPADLRMHVAVATSLAVVTFTTLSSSYAHYKKGSTDLALIKRWGPFIALGSICGIAIASLSSSRILSAVFGVMTMLVAMKMLLPFHRWVLCQAPPSHALARLIPLAIGGLSSLMGIGGGTLGVPTLTLLNFPVHKAVGTAAAFGVLISIPGTLGYILSGMLHAQLPLGYLGYVNLIGLVLVAPLAVFTAPLGAKIAHGLSGKTLESLFGAFLTLVSLRMLFKVFA